MINQILEYTKNAQEGDMRTSYSALEKIENDKIVDFLIKEASEKLNQYAIRALGKHIDSKALPILINISQKKLTT